MANPAALVEVGFYDPPGYAEGVALGGNYPYVADGDLGLRIINVANPAAPVGVGFYSRPHPSAVHHRLAAVRPARRGDVHDRPAFQLAGASTLAVRAGKKPTMSIVVKHSP